MLFLMAVWQIWFYLTISFNDDQVFNASEAKNSHLMHLKYSACDNSSSPHCIMTKTWALRAK